VCKGVIDERRPNVDERSISSATGSLSRLKPLHEMRRGHVGPARDEAGDPTLAVG